MQYWKEKYSVNVLEFDEDHRQLLIAIGDTCNAFKESNDKDNLIPVVNSLIKKVLSHCKKEEEYLIQLDDEDILTHRMQHRILRDMLCDLLLMIEMGDTVTATNSVLPFLRKWLVDHINKSDNKYSAALVF